MKNSRILSSAGTSILVPIISIIVVVSKKIRSSILFLSKTSLTSHGEDFVKIHDLTHLDSNKK